MADVVALLGEAGDGLEGTDIPCMVQKSVFDAGSPSDFFGTNGVPLQTGGLGNVVFSGPGSFTIDITDTTNILAGIYAWLDTQGLNDAGWYLIESVDSGSILTCSTTPLNGDTGIVESASNTGFSIGGLGEIDSPDVDDKFQLLLDLMGTYVTSLNNLDILLNQPVTIDQTVDIDNISGSTTTRQRLIGTDPAFDDDGTQIEIDTTTELALGLFDFSSSGASVYVSFENIDANGGGKDATRAAFCVNESDTTGASDNNFFINCTFRGASSEGVHQESDAWDFYKCLFTLNGSHGFNAPQDDGQDDQFHRCIFLNNGASGLRLGSATNTISGCIADGNITGFNLTNSAPDDCIFSDNLAISNTGNGFNISVNANRNRFYNNSAVSNGGYGYNFNGQAPSNLKFFGYNHAYNNTLNPLFDTASRADAYFLTFLQGNNIVGDPLLIDYIPSSSSPLNDAGLGGTGDTIGALCAEAGGGVMPLTGLLS